MLLGSNQILHWPWEVQKIIVVELCSWESFSGERCCFIFIFWFFFRFFFFGTSASELNFHYDHSVPSKGLRKLFNWKKFIWCARLSQTVQEMMMLSTSVLSIKWTIKGKPKNAVLAGIGGDLVVSVSSRFTLNQISGQVIEHEESWDLSSSSIVAQAYFWASRTLYSAIQAGNDTIDSAKKMTRRLSPEKENTEIFPDPLGDPTKASSWVWWSH